ncbi:DeoR/GlpR family DNA-binding transcription regulator [Paenibacillus sp. WLX1005]|uniref:DeoR/GlpR family DNA-binding transcription regulator n=2 Tax=unclassified Paenibacillus TaxID=185978 RepID=UPI00398405B7
MKARRLQDIEEYIRTQKSVTLDELCVRFDVSKNTIRRDINQIVQKGSIEKVYGGVTSASELVPFENRNIRNQSKKNEIGRLAAACIEAHDLIYIDSGTTTRNIIDHLDPALPLTILTNSLDVINGVADMQHVTLLVIGNTYKPKTRSFVGMDNPLSLQKYNVNKAFMAATGVSMTHGLTNSDLLEYEIKKVIAEKAQKLILLADNSKFGKSTLLTYAPLKDVDILISSEPLDDDYRSFCEQHHIQLQSPS